MGPQGFWGSGRPSKRWVVKNSAPCQRNRFRPETTSLGVATVMDPVAIHLKAIDEWELKVNKEVIDANIGAEGTPIVILDDCPLIGDISVTHSRLRKP